MTTTRRRLVFAGVVLATAVLMGVLYGLLTAFGGLSDRFETWWGTAFRAAVAVVVCFRVAGLVDRRLTRSGDPGRE